MGHFVPLSDGNLFPCRSFRRDSFFPLALIPGLVRVHFFPEYFPFPPAPLKRNGFRSIAS